MHKNFLVLSKINNFYPKNKKLFYLTKYRLKLDLLKKNFDKKKIKFINDYNSGENNNTNIKFINKKIETYRPQLSKKLNTIHNINFSNRYWGIILDKYLFMVIQSILINFQAIKKLKKKVKNISILLDSYKFFTVKTLQDFAELEKKRQLNNFIIINIFSKLFKDKKILNKIRLIEFMPQKKKIGFKFLILNFFLRYYVKIFSPILILNSYLGKNFSLKIFLKSFGRILMIPEKNFFKKKKFSFEQDLKLRNQIQIKQKDEFDTIFNLINKVTLPASILENYIEHQKNINFAKNVRVLGSAMLIINNDDYKFLAAQTKEQKGKLVSFQHGANIGLYDYSIQEMVEKRYCDKRFFWSQKDGLGSYYFNRLEKHNNLAVRNNILILPTAKHFHEFPFSVHNRFNKKKFHPFENINYNFFSLLDKKVRKNSIVKLFPQEENNHVKKIWKETCGKDVNIVTTTSLKKKLQLFNKSKIVVLDDISTPFYELIYMDIPFIVIIEELREYNKEFRKMIKNLKKLNIFFSNSYDAAKFINKNFNDVNAWWKIVIRKKEYKNFKKKLIVINKLEDSKKFVKSLKFN